MTEAAAARRAVFVDRDGVLVEEVGHIHRAQDLQLSPGAAEAVRLLRAAGLLVIVVTNQSAVARGLVSEAGLHVIHERLRALLAAEGAAIDDLVYCPHHPTHGQPPYRLDCACRKPAPGMLLEAAARHGLDLAGSVLIGDKRSDVEAARRAGCGAILVRTGHGSTEEATPPASALEVPDLICDDIGQAARAICPGPARSDS